MVHHDARTVDDLDPSTKRRDFTFLMKRPKFLLVKWAHESITSQCIFVNIVFSSPGFSIWSFNSTKQTKRPRHVSDTRNPERHSHLSLLERCSQSLTLNRRFDGPPSWSLDAKRKWGEHKKPVGSGGGVDSVGMMRRSLPPKMADHENTAKQRLNLPLIRSNWSLQILKTFY